MSRPLSSPLKSIARVPSWLRRLASALDPWAPPLALMGVIWFFSSQPDLSSGLGTIDLIGRKLIHAAEYALLCLLWWRALRSRLPGQAALALALLVAVLYGAVDEYHQTFVTGRSGSPIDVAIDATGAGLAAFAIGRRQRAAAAVSGARS